MIGVIGLGNVLMRDDGFGIEVVNTLKNNFTFEPEIEVIDGGAGNFALPFYKFKKLIIVDAVKDPGKKPADILMYFKEDILQGKICQKFSMHDVSLDEMFLLLDLRNELPEDIVLIGAVPMDLDTGIGLSLLLKEKVYDVVKEVLRVLNLWGIKVKKRKIIFKKEEWKDLPWRTHESCGD